MKNLLLDNKKEGVDLEGKGWRENMNKFCKENNFS